MDKIYCPQCGRRVLQADERATISLSVKCKNCKKIVVYNPRSKTSRLEDIPTRKSASGIRFY